MLKNKIVRKKNDKNIKSIYVQNLYKRKLS